jgi:hypothetical protein
MSQAKVSVEFVEKYKDLIEKGRNSQPKTFKDGSPRRVVTDLARAECDYSNITSPNHIWNSVISKYFDVFKV